MVTSVHGEVASDNPEQKRTEGSICDDESQSKQEVSTTDIVSELSQNESGESQKSEEVLEKKVQIQSSDCVNIDKKEANTRDNTIPIKCSDTGSHGSHSRKGERSLSSTLDITPDTLMKTPSRYSDKSLEDGYNWRKYGQKLVKGNEFVRSYYRCTHPNCRAKRQVERSQEGQITDTVYLGRHEHAQPQLGSQITVCSVSPINAIGPYESSLATEEDKSSEADGPIPTCEEAQPIRSPQFPSTIPTNNIAEVIDRDGDPISKKQKRDVCNVDETPVEKPNYEPRFVGDPRVVVQNMTDVDILNDGYRWRKYGQKLVKGNANPRSYYRCSSSGCPVKKHVERASHDPKVFITTYEGQHDHNIPPARTVTPNKRGANANTTSDIKDESRSKPEENSAFGREMGVHISTQTEACS